MDESRTSGLLNVLEGKNALVIGGGGGGIGRAITRALAAAGSAVGVADVDHHRADEAAAEVAAAGGKAVSLTGDVTSRGDVDGLVRRAARELGGLDILVTVVGGQMAFVPPAPLHETTDEDWDLIDLNLRYVAQALRATLRVFLAQGTGGTIVSVGSITGIAGSPMQAAYGAAKAGLASLARSVAAEYSRDGIRMNLVTCGAIATPVAQAAHANAAPEWIPIGRSGSSDEVADATVFLASPLSSYITGQSLVIDGGATAVGPFPIRQAEIRTP
jgi:3-oxoacyl-[acyl-carrier protein] reductase